MKIGVLFNCQHAGLAACLRQILPGHEVLNHRFADVSHSDQAAEAAASELRACDVIITTPTGTKLRAADPNLLGVRVISIPHLVFGGYHPDACYSADPTQGIPGPTERFHSRIAACAFLAGLDVEDTIPLYSKLPFARLGYFDHFAQQRAAMIEQWAGHGVDLLPWFDRWARAGCFMHSTNHPKIIALHGIATIICEKLGLAPHDAGDMLPQDPMLIYASHPVHADLATSLGVAAETHFRRPGASGRAGESLDLAAFLTSSFAAFAAAPIAAVRDLGGVAHAMRALDLSMKRPS